MNEVLEYAQENDAFYNYCLYEYSPLTPVAGKLRSVSLLRHSFSFMNAGGAMYDLITALQQAVGPGKTVWGLKKDGETIFWEYYFYDYRRRDRERSLSKVLEAIRPWAPARIVPNENLHYFMFSIDITDDLLGGNEVVDTAHIYIGNPGSAVSAGICYAVSEKGSRLENFYHFYHPVDQMDEIISKVVCSAQIDDLKVPLEDILWPELRQCVTICCANKPWCDCIYFSGITVDQFLFFLGRMDYPRPLVAFVEQHRDQLDHLLFDVGFDYYMKNGALVIPKSSYYGTF